MIKIAFCEDDLKQQEYILEVLEQYMNTHPSFICMKQVFNNAEDLLNYVEDHGPFDVYVLDIMLPQNSGMDVAKLIRLKDQNARIIFITSEREFALEAFSVHAYDYLLKPVQEDRLVELFDSINELNKEASDSCVLVKTQKGIEKINLNDLIYIESAGRRAIYYLYDGKKIQSNMLRQPFKKEVNEIISDKRFMLCGTSFVVNLHQIKSIRDEELYFKRGQVVTPPRKYYNEIKNTWLDYWFENTI